MDVFALELAYKAWDTPRPADQWVGLWGGAAGYAPPLEQIKQSYLSHRLQLSSGYFTDEELADGRRAYDERFLRLIGSHLAEAVATFMPTTTSETGA